MVRRFVAYKTKFLGIMRIVFAYSHKEAKNTTYRAALLSGFEGRRDDVQTYRMPRLDRYACDCSPGLCYSLKRFPRRKK